jgi:hypothetical protein
MNAVALMQDRVPSQAGYAGLDFQKMIEAWDILVNGVKGMVEFLEAESIFDAQRLPSIATLPVLAALWQYMPQSPDPRGNARIVLRKYLWRSFLTERYERSSATYSLQDYRSIKALFQKMAQNQNAGDISIPIFNEDDFPLPTPEVVLRAGWPKLMAIRARGLLALQIKAGAEDLADGARASKDTIRSKDRPREYHHLFPDANLSNAGVSDDEIHRAVNCALITWKTNRVISNKDPVAYLKERADNSTLGEPELKRRLRTHLIPYDKLNVGGYDEINGAQRKEQITKDYRGFAYKRAELLAKAANMVCEGRNLDLSEIYQDQ